MSNSHTGTDTVWTAPIATHVSSRYTCEGWTRHAADWHTTRQTVKHRLTSDFLIERREIFGVQRDAQILWTVAGNC